MKTSIINDGSEISNTLIDEWNIHDLINYSSEKNTANFVGIIIKYNKILMSFPKHCDVTDENNDTINALMRKILNLFCIERLKHNNINQKIYNNFPISSYMFILTYFKKYGLFKNKNVIYNNDFIGQIDWIRTFNSNNKILQNNGIIFLPFIVKKYNHTDAFIGFCMDYILDDALKYSNFIEMISPYKKKYNYCTNISIDKIIYKLKLIKGIYFKDNEKKLINNIIYYLEWKSYSHGMFRFVTTSFEYYWEKLIMSFLNSNHILYKNDQLIFSGKYNNIEKKFIKYSDKVESEHILTTKKTRQFSIEYDHIYINEHNKIIYIFDSKYYSKINELNYKQIFYHYHLLSKYKYYTIINGLILPTSHQYYSRIHIDRMDIDNVKVVEHYFNIKYILNNYTLL